MREARLKTSALRFCVAIILLAAPLSSYADDWPQLQHDPARSGYSPDAGGPATGTEWVVKWRWHPDRKTSVAGRVQPVIANGILCIGFYNGVMYGVDANTGALRWSFKSGGPILHTAAMDASKVYFGSHDGFIYALNQGDGSLAWKYDTGHPIHTAPCLANNAVYIGNISGNMYAVSTSGSLLWTYSSGRPIETSAAYANGTVYCGNEGIYAFALDANTGAQKWKVRLKGQSLFAYWPVVMAAKGVVFFRSETAWQHNLALDHGDALLGGNGNYDQGDGTPTDFQNEYATIRSFLSANKDDQSFWALNTADGSEKYIAPILTTAGEGVTPVPPVFDPATNRAWVLCRSRYSRFDSGSIVRSFGAEPAKLNPDTGEYTLFGTAATVGSGVHLIGDETSVISADAYGLLISGRGTLGYIRHATESAQHVVSSQDPNDDDYSHPPSPLTYTSTSGWPTWSVEAGGGSGGGQASAAAVANNSIYWISRWGLLARMDKQ